jgi:putative SOS response-associated peptidase YedK
MIEQYSISASSDKIIDRFAIDGTGLPKPIYNASPTQLLPVITHNAPKGISTFYWGTSPEWSKNKSLSEKIVNTHVELISERSSLKKSLMKTRCIIPADGFFAWKKTGKKTFIPYRFVCKDQDIFSFAGLWEEFEDTDGNELHTFSIVTTPSNSIVGNVSERMPVILNKKTEAIWMNKESTEETLLKILKDYPSEQMTFYPVSPRIKDPGINVPSLIIPTQPSDQHGNLTLFD